MKKIIIVWLFVINLILIHATDNSTDTADNIKRVLKNKSEIEQIMLLDKYIKNSPENINLYLLQAKLSIKIRDFIGAKAILKTALVKDALNTEILNYLGLVSFFLKEWNEATNYFNQVLKKEPTNKFALTYLTIIDPFYNINDQNNFVDGDYEKVNIRTLEKSYKPQDDNSDYGLVYLLDRRETTIIDEEHYNYTIHCVVKITKSKGIDYFRNFSYSYNGYEFYPQVIRAGTYDKNYNFTSIDYKNAIIVDNQDTAHSSMYTNRKNISFPLPKVHVGSIIEYRIKFSNTGKKITPKVFDYFLFSSRVKIVKSQYFIRYPKNLKFIVKQRSNLIKEETRISEDMIEKRYVIENPPVYDINNEMVTLFDVSPAIFLSTFKNWEEIGNWYADIIDKKVNSTNISKAIIEQLNLSNDSISTKIKKIYQYIQKNIYYIGIELGESAFIPHSPTEIINTKYGDCKDQVTLFIQLLKNIGVKAYPALIPTFGDLMVVKEVPSPYYFNHVIVYIPKQNGIDNDLFLDTTSSVTEFANLPSQDQGVESFIISQEKSFFKMTPVMSYDKNKIEEYYKITVDLIGNGTVEFTENLMGAYSEILRSSLVNKNQTEIKNELFNMEKKTFTRLKKDNFKVKGITEQSGPISISLTAPAKEICGVYYDGTQKFTYSVGDLKSYFKFPEDLKYDHKVSYLYSYKKVNEYIFPKGYSLVNSRINNFSKENEYISFNFNADKVEDNHLIFTIEFHLKKRIIDKNDIKDINKFFDLISSSVKYELTLKNSEDFDEEKFYEELLKEYQTKQVYENYSRVLYKNQEYDKALSVTQEGIKKFPNDVDLYAIKSAVYIDQKNYEAAKEILITGIDKNKDALNLYFYLMDLYQHSNEDSKIEALLEQANNHIKNNEQLISATLGYFNRTKQYKKSLDYLQRYLNEDPDNSSRYSDLGYVYSLMKEFKKAEGAYLKSIELDRENGVALNNLAWLYCENNTKIDKAIDYSKKACELQPLNDTFYDTLAEAYFLAQKYELAIEAIKKALKINPNYTYLQQQLKKIEEAKTLMEKKKTDKSK